MRCKNCGKKLSKKNYICPKCGTAVERLSKAENTGTEKSVLKKKFSDFWHSLDKFGKALFVFLIIFVCEFFSQASNGKAGVAAVVFIQVVLCAFSWLIKRGKVKSHQKRLPAMLFALALVLIIPLSAIQNSTDNKPGKMIWSDIMLGEMLPEPVSSKGQIITNTDEKLFVLIEKINEEDYNDYVDECEEKGYTIEAKNSEITYDAFNSDGYRLILEYDTSGKKMQVELNAPMQLGEITWSESRLAKLLPVPEFNLGKVESDDASQYSVYLGDITYDNFVRYTERCTENGFNADITSTEMIFEAKNADDYLLKVKYVGNGIIYVSVSEPQYNIEVKVNFTRPLFDSEYSVKAYADDIILGELESSKDFSCSLSRGTHVFKFTNAKDSNIGTEVKMKIDKQETLQFNVYVDDGEIKTDVISGNVEYQIDSVSFDNVSDISFTYKKDENRSFSAKITPNPKASTYGDVLDFISENPEIVTIKYDDFLKQAVITPVNNGETYVYIQSKDGSIQSGRIKVTVDFYIETTAEFREDDTTVKRSGRTVYITPYGEKYHYSKSCAGKNAMDRDLDDIKYSYSPCKKCVK